MRKFTNELLQHFKNSNEPINNNGGYFQEENIKIEIIKKSIIITDLTNSLASGNECDIKIFKTTQKFGTMTDFLAERDITSFKELLEAEKIPNFRIKKDFAKAIRVYSPFAKFNLVKEPKKWTKTHLSKAIINGQVSCETDVVALAIALIEKENLESSIKVVSTNNSYTELNVSSLDIKSINVKFYNDVITSEVFEDSSVEEIVANKTVEIVEVSYEEVVADRIKNEISIDKAVTLVTEVGVETTIEEAIIVMSPILKLVKLFNMFDVTQSLLVNEKITPISEVSNYTKIEEATIEFIVSHKLLQVSILSTSDFFLCFINSKLLILSSLVLIKQYNLKANEKYY